MKLSWDGQVMFKNIPIFTVWRAGYPVQHSRARGHGGRYMEGRAMELQRVDRVVSDFLLHWRTAARRSALVGASRSIERTFQLT